MNAAISGAVLAALVPAFLSACSSDAEGSGEPVATETVTVTAAPDAQPLVLSTGAVESAHCFADGPPGDLAWYDVQWKANVDLDELWFAITGDRGLTQVGSAKSARPVNFGGRIDFGGTSTWEGHRKVVRENPFLRGDLEPVDLESAVTGETGLVVLHLRFDPDTLASAAGAGFDGVRATYTTADGEQGESRVAVDEVFRAGDC